MPPATPLIVIGAGGHARVVSDIVRLMGQHAIVGFLDDVNPERHGSLFCGATILGGVERLTGLAGAGVRHACVAVGDCVARLRLAGLAAGAGFELPVLIHPSAVRAADAAVGSGTVLVAGSVVNPGARVGANVIINTGASVDHDCTIEDGVHIAVGARLAGHVSVGRGTWIGGFVVAVIGGLQFMYTMYTTA